MGDMDFKMAGTREGFTSLQVMPYFGFSNWVRQSTDIRFIDQRVVLTITISGTRS